jgi:hypothetical protein
MKLYELHESVNTPIIVVDVQPEYASFAKKIVNRGLFDYLNEQRGPILAFFNGEETTNDSKQEVVDYWIENGFDPDELDKIEWHNKTYGYFRDWMAGPDHGVDISDSLIIKVIREMYQKRISDSQDFDDEELLSLVGEEIFDYCKNYSIWLPSIAVTKLRDYTNSYICGGARHECLREITLLMNAFNIKYKMIDKFVY